MRSTVDAIIDAATQATDGRYASLRFGDVTAVDGGLISVDLAGASVGNIPVISTYTPTVGDRVWLLSQGSIMVALGATTKEA